MMTGSASLSAAAALALSPVANASSTLPRVLRRRERRDLLISVRRAMTRVAFLAELVFAMLVSDRLFGVGCSNAKSRRRQKEAAAQARRQLARFIVGAPGQVKARPKRLAVPLLGGAFGPD